MIKRLLPRSIVGRTTLSIVALAILIGTLFATVTAWRLHLHERERLLDRLEQLLATVESTASIACFVRDEVLAHEIAAGLLHNSGVAAARIIADQSVLAEATNDAEPVQHDSRLVISRALRSPFDPAQIVGSVELIASQTVLRSLAWRDTRFVVIVLGLELLLIAAAVAWVVYNLITRPIKSISDEMHRLELRTGMRLRIPKRNREDELGRLVSDVNALIAELTSLIDTERALRLEREASERRLTLVFEKVDAGIFEIDEHGRLQSWNPAFARTLGEPQEGDHLEALAPEHAGRLRSLIHDTLNSGRPHEADLELHQPNGLAKWAEISLTPIEDRMLQGVINDITERKRAELAAQQLAQRDTLTGLLNRRGLDAGLSAAFERRSHDPSIKLTFLAIDLDHFKDVNDAYGHAAGDLVLQQVAEILERAVRRSDLVARPGGDEFSIVLVGAEGSARAAQIANDIIAEISQPIDLGDGCVARVGASIGIAEVAAPERDPAAGLHRADEAMYTAKQTGRGRAVTAAPPAPA